MGQDPLDHFVSEVREDSWSDLFVRTKRLALVAGVLTIAIVVIASVLFFR
jgi:hypothetical protein